MPWETPLSRDFSQGFRVFPNEIFDLRESGLASPRAFDEDRRNQKKKKNKAKSE
jgi:hypothetical protein